MITNKTTELLNQLKSETSKGKISWEAIDPPTEFDLGGENNTPLIYFSIVKGKKLAIFIERYKYYTDVDDFSWSERLTFAILTHNWKIIWSFTEYTPALRDLFDTVSNQAAGVDKLLSELLDKDLI